MQQPIFSSIKLFILKATRRNFRLSICFSVYIIINIGCNKLVDIPEPVNSLTSEKIFSTDANATSALMGIYSDMSWHNGALDFASGAVTINTGLSSDELSIYGNTVDPFLNNILLSQTSELYAQFWAPMYSAIYKSNAVIEGLQSSSNVSLSTKSQLTGEAKFIRAFCHFYLLNLFGDVPLITTTVWNNNNTLSRSSIQDVYQQIVDDLKDAQSLMSSDYSIAGGARIRANKWAAAALLSRVYLYTSHFVDATEQASNVINNNELYNLVMNLDSTFLKNNNEAIWQLQVIDNNPWATREGNKFIPEILTRNFPPSVVQSNWTFFVPPYYLTQQLVNAFEPGDQRKSKWADSTGLLNGTNYFYPSKFKIKQGSSGNIKECYTTLRLAEQYLIRAEALAKQNKLSEALTDLNIIRKRAGLPNLLSSLSQTELLATIAQENRIEFFAEWGHRWFDLKRLGQADGILGSVKGSNWQTTDQFYPIPNSELQRGPNLTQNPGYL